MKRQVTRDVTVAMAILGLLGLQAACNTRPATQEQAAAQDGSTPPGVQTDPAAERQVITLTGCLTRGVSPGEFTLASVATGGVLDAASPGTADDRQRQQGAESRPDPESQAALMAATSYRLIPGDDDLAQYEGQRVTVSGRLAAQTPATSARPGTPSTGTQVESGPTSTTVAADAPDLRGFHVASVRKVSDSCEAGDRN